MAGRVNYGAAAAFGSEAKEGVAKATSRDTRATDILFEKKEKDLEWNRSRAAFKEDKLSQLQLAMSPADKLVYKYELDSATGQPTKKFLTPNEQAAAGKALTGSVEGLERIAKGAFGTDNTASSVPGSSDQAHGPLAGPRSPAADASNLAMATQGPLASTAASEDAAIAANQARYAPEQAMDAGAQNEFFRQNGMTDAPEPIKAIMNSPGGQDKFFHALAFMTVFGMDPNNPDLLEGMMDFEGWRKRKANRATLEEELLREQISTARAGREYQRDDIALRREDLQGDQRFREKSFDKDADLRERELTARLEETKLGREHMQAREEFQNRIQLADLELKEDMFNRELDQLDDDAQAKIRDILGKATDSWNEYVTANNLDIDRSFWSLNGDADAQRVMKYVDDWARMKLPTTDPEIVAAAKRAVKLGLANNFNDNWFHAGIKYAAGGAAGGAALGGIPTGGALALPGAIVGAVAMGVGGAVGTAIDTEEPTEGFWADQLRSTRREIDKGMGPLTPAPRVKRPSRYSGIDASGRQR